MPPRHAFFFSHHPPLLTLPSHTLLLTQLHIAAPPERLTVRVAHTPVEHCSLSTPPLHTHTHSHFHGSHRTFHAVLNVFTPFVNTMNWTLLATLHHAIARPLSMVTHSLSSLDIQASPSQPQTSEHSVHPWHLINSSSCAVSEISTVSIPLRRTHSQSLQSQFTIPHTPPCSHLPALACITFFLLPLLLTRLFESTGGVSPIHPDPFLSQRIPVHSEPLSLLPSNRTDHSAVPKEPTERKQLRAVLAHCDGMEEQRRSQGQRVILEYECEEVEHRQAEGDLFSTEEGGYLSILRSGVHAESYSPLRTALQRWRMCHLGDTSGISAEDSSPRQ